jgi:hypothetical protein
LCSPPRAVLVVKKPQEWKTTRVRTDLTRYLRLPHRTRRCHVPRQANSKRAALGTQRGRRQPSDPSSARTLGSAFGACLSASLCALACVCVCVVLRVGLRSEPPVCLFVCAQALLTLARWLTAERNVPTFKCTHARNRAGAPTHAQATALQVDVYVEAAVYDELAEHSQTDLVKVLKTRRVLLSTLEIRRFWGFNADRAMVLASYLWDPYSLAVAFAPAGPSLVGPAGPFQPHCPIVVFLFRSPCRLHRCRMHGIFASRTRSRRALSRAYSDGTIKCSQMGTT